MVGNGSVEYDHDRDGRTTDLGGCNGLIRNVDHDTFLLIRYMKNRLTVSDIFLTAFVLWIETYIYFMFCILGDDRCGWEARVEGLSGHPRCEASAGLLFWSLIGHWRFIRCGSQRSSHLFCIPILIHNIYFIVVKTVSHVLFQAVCFRFSRQP